MRCSILTLSLAGFSLVSAPASAKDSDPVSLEPTSQWNVDFGEHTCRLARIYGDADNRHLLFFEQTWPSTGFGLTAAGPAFKGFKHRKPTEMWFSNQGESDSSKPYKGTVEDVGPALIYSTAHLARDSETSSSPPGGLAQLDIEAARSAAFVAFKQGGKAVTFQTGPLGKAFKVLNICTQDLVRSWGLDLDRHLDAQSLPNWLNRDEISRRIGRLYPSAAVRKGEQAIVRMRAMIDENGKVTDCHLLDATDTERLESPACKAMMEAEFSPAIDAQGEPFPSYHAETVVYLL